MELDDLKRLVDAFEASEWDEVHLELDGTTVHLSTNPGAAAAVPAPAAPASPAVAPTDVVPGEGANGTLDAPDAARVPFAPQDPGSGEPVRAASPGIFWHAPAPGQPPFVSVGDTVTPDSVVGIVELMKLMNRVTADVAGVVTAVCVGNGETVEKGAVLVRVETS